jgi:hypothetical protein
MKSYCYECGVKLEYPVNEKPKFCHNCGTPFGDKAQSPKQPPQHTGPDVVAVAAEEAIDSPANDAKSVPVINGLDFEIHHIKPNTFKLGEVMEQQVAEIEASDGSIQPMNIPPRKGGVKKGNRKKFLQNWEKEGGTLRSKKPKNNV